MKIATLACSLFLVGCGIENLEPIPPRWGPAVTQELNALGFGNWIVVAEASFPVHSGRGVRTVSLDAEIPEVVDYIVDSYDNAENVTPTFSTARELPFVQNDRAPGIDFFRRDGKSISDSPCPEQFKKIRHFGDQDEDRSALLKCFHRTRYRLLGSRVRGCAASCDAQESRDKTN
jgi:hypothetical protein